MPLRKTPSKVPAPPMLATGAPSFGITWRFVRSAARASSERAIAFGRIHGFNRRICQQNRQLFLFKIIRNILVSSLSALILASLAHAFIFILPTGTSDSSPTLTTPILFTAYSLSVQATKFSSNSLMNFLVVSSVTLPF
jgi:hypothetical protein